MSAGKESGQPRVSVAMTKLTKEEMAARITGREYGQEMTPQDKADAKQAGLVIVYGASDDLMEFDGAICDELGCCDGGTALLDSDGVLDRDRIDSDDDDEVADFVARKRNAKSIRACWCEVDGYSWTYETDIPHATFEIVEAGEPYCRGIVFALEDLP